MRRLNMRKIVAWGLFLVFYIWAATHCFAAATTTFGDFVHNSPEITSPSGNDQLPIVRGASSNKVKLSTITDGVRPEWFGTNTTPGTTDMATAINNAIAGTYNATTGTYGTVKFGPYDYRVNSKINAVNKKGLKLIGDYSFDGTGGTRILGYTGANQPIIDTIGSSGLTLSGITMQMVTSTLCHITGWDASNNTGTFGSTYQDLNCETAATSWDPSANGGLGRIGFVNIGGETVTYLGMMKATATLPFVFASLPTTTWILGDSSPTFDFRTVNDHLPATWSLGMLSAGGANFVAIAYGIHRPGMAVNNMNTSNFPTVYTNTSGLVYATDERVNVGLQYHSGFDNYFKVMHESDASGNPIALAVNTADGDRFDVTAPEGDASGTISMLWPSVAFYGEVSTVVRNSSFHTYLSQAADTLGNVRYAYGAPNFARWTNYPGTILTSQLYSNAGSTRIVDASTFARLSTNVDYCGESFCYNTSRPNNSATWNFGAIANDASTATTITVWDASPGDVCTVAHSGAAAGDVFTCQVVSYSGTTRLGTVAVLYYNRSGGNRSPSGYLNVRAFK
jgi:hypothetical protein